MSDFSDFANALNGFGQEGAQTTDPATTADTTAPETQATGTESGTPPPATETQGAAETTPPGGDKAASAFAAMRVENARLKKVLDTLDLGVDVNASLEDKLAAFDKKSNEQEAKRMNIPPELLQRIEEQDRFINEIKQREVRQTLADNFGTLMQQCKLTTEQVYEFAQDLAARGIDATKIGAENIISFYRGTHFDDLVKTQVQQAVQEALTKSNTSAEHSTKPSAQQGAPATDGSGTVTMRDFEAALSGYNK